MKTRLLISLILLAGLTGLTGLESRAGNCQASFNATPDSTGYVFSFTNTSTGNFNYVQWSFGDGTGSNVFNPTHAYNGSGYAIVCLTVWDTLIGCQSTVCDTILINQGLNCFAQFTYSITGTTVNFYNGSFGGGNTTVTWDFGDGNVSSVNNPVHVYAPNNSYTACLIITDPVNQCTDTACMTFYINPPNNCNANFAMTDSSNYYYFFPDVYNADYDYFWDFGDGSTSTSAYPVHTYNGNGPWVACLTVTDSTQGCTASHCDTIYTGTNITCDAQFTASNSQGIYYFQPVNYNPNLDYFWSFGDGSSSNIAGVTHIYNAPGTYLVCLTVSDSTQSCYDISCDTIVISGNPATCDPSFTVIDSSGYAFLIPNTYNLNYYYYWTFNGQTSTSPYAAFSYNAPGYYTVCLFVTDSTQQCSASSCDSVYLGNPNPGCTVNIGYQTGSNNNIYYFQANTSGTGGNYTWSFGDGSSGTGMNPVHTYTTPGTYTVCVYFSSFAGCVDTSCVMVTVQPSSGCQAYFTTTYQNNFFTFTNNSQGNPTHYNWSFGDGTSSTSMSPNHTYTQAGIYQVCLTITDSINQCSDTYCDTVIVNSNPVNCTALFSVIDTAGLHYFLSAGGNGMNHSWTFGDGTSGTGAYPWHQYASAGWYTVCHTVTDSAFACSDTWCDSIYVGGMVFCNASFSYTTDTITNTVTFINTSIGGTTNYWYLGDGNSATVTNPVHQYPGPGTYLVCLTIYDNAGCQSSYCDSIMIGTGANCLPQFYANPDSTFGNGVVYFGILNQCPNTQYVWTFGDSTTATGPSPVHQFPATGWYSVCVTAYVNGLTYNWCDSVYALRLGSTGLTENAVSGISIYPNPSSGPVTLQYNLLVSGEVKTEILTADGRLVYSNLARQSQGKQEIRIDNELSSGVYILQVSTGGYRSTHRLIVQ